MHAQRKHARLSPSKADMWMECTASIGLIEKINPPNKTTPAADEGTAAHELLEMAVKKKRHPSKFIGTTFNKVWKVTDEMADAVAVLYDYVIELELNGWKIYSEIHLDHISCTEEGGTVDILAIKGNRIIVIDYKHGRGVRVSSKRNKQMMLYTIGAIEYFKLKPKTIDIIIAQPRISRELEPWTLTYDELMEFAAEATAARKAINAGKVSFNPGKKQCMWCPVNGDCEHFGRAAIQSVGMDFDKVCKVKTTEVPKFKSSQLSAFAANLEFFDLFLSKLRERLYEAAARGQLKGFKLVNADTNRRWTDKDTVATVLKRKFDLDDVMPRSLIGITEAARLFKDKKECEKFMNRFTERPVGKPILVPKDDLRPSINPGEDFANI